MSGVPWRAFMLIVCLAALVLDIIAGLTGWAIVMAILVTYHAVALGFIVSERIARTGGVR